MRIARLDLVRFGSFTDRTLTLPNAKVDLHLVVGLNEAGKSTLRQAIVDLLYGIPVRTDYDFKHHITELLLGGVIENGGVPFEFQRFKRNKQPLINAAGLPFTEQELNMWLGGTDREFFERNFGLDYKSLVDGAKEILKSSGDVGQMLFQAAAGLSGVHKVRTALELEATALWGPWARADAAYYSARKRFEEAEATLKQVSVSSHKWLTARRALDAATAAARKSLDTYREIESRRERLERIRRVTPTLQQMRAAIAERDGMGTPALLPKAAETTLTAAEAEIAAADAQQALLTPRLQRDETALAAIVLNSPVTGHNAAIDSLAARVTSFLKSTNDLPQVQAQADAKIDFIRASAKEIGWNETGMKEIAEKLPTRLVRAEIHALIRTRETLAAEAQRAEKDRRDKATALEELDRLIKSAPTIARWPALDNALAAARTLDLAPARAKAEQTVKLAEDRLADALSKLTPWRGDAAALRQLAPPDPAEIQRFTKQRTSLETRRDVAAENLRAKKAEAARAKVAAQEFRRHNDPVTEEALHGQRTKRDALWQDLRGGAKTLATVGDTFEGEVRAADGLADRRYVGAAVVEKAQMLDTQYRSIESEIDVLQQQEEEAKTDLADLNAEWAAGMTALGLADFAADRLPTWAQDRNSALAAAQSVNAAKLELDGLLARAKAVAEALHAALATASALTDHDGDLEALIEQAAAHDAAQADARAQFKSRQDQRDAAQLALPALVTEANETTSNWKEWQDAWARQLKAAGLPPETGTAGATEALALLTEMAVACTDVTDKETTRLRPMREDIETFTADARALAKACLPAVAALAPADIASRLADELQQAQQAAKDHARLATAVKQTTQERDKAVKDAALAAAKIAPLLATAKVTTRDELRAAVKLADAYREADKRAHDAEDALRTGGDGLPLDRLAEDVDGEDPAELATRLQEALAERDAAEAERDNCIRVRTQAEDAFKQIAGQDDAVRAESLRRDALLLMGDSVDEYVRITVGAKLLRWAIDRYREEKQEPLLRRASELFKTLTCGRFKKLSPNFDVEPVRLNAQRADDSMLPISAFSTGTEDQLYLALRLAALELHLENATALPFIGDDIFVHWDDERAGAGFAALAELATRTQVIVLTHHHHLVDVAHQATGGKINIIQL